VEAVDLQAKKMRLQDYASSTEESLGVTEAVSTPVSKNPHQKWKKPLT